MTSDLREMKAAYDALPGPSAEATARAREVMLAPRPRPKRRLLRAGTVGLAAAVAAVAFVVFPGGGATPAGAAELLQRAATAAARQPAPLKGQFVYVRQREQRWILTLAEGGARSEYTEESDTESWIPAADPAGALMRTRYGRRTVHSGQVPDTMPTPGTVAHHTGQCAALVAADTSNLPTDPGELLARIRADAEATVGKERPEPTEDQFRRQVERTVASRLLTLAQNPFPGYGLREAVLGALARLPAATMRTDLTDAAGRQGVGASIRYQGPDGAETAELIFEPDTYRFLGWRVLSQRPDGGAEVLRAATATLEVKIVDTMPEIPADAPPPTTC
ncbi:CU044_5270 family protein [Nonomuraea sp. NPDC050790]|uniref:CU044_5270 family protein n=1 Tax=Nonomuraea sp. NPDC050790 TaxID=3364371 RepID=UPI0037881092